jgi:hypothetical protein
MTWFRNEAWEARNASDSSLLRLGWAIDNVLYQYENDPDDVTVEIVGAELVRLVKDFQSLHEAG